MQNALKVIPFIAIIVCAVVSPVAAQTVQSATLLSGELRARDVSLHSIRNGTLRFFDEDRTLQTERLADFLQIQFDAGKNETPTTRSIFDPASETADEAHHPRVHIDLTDGQQLHCLWLGGADEGQSLNYQIDGVTLRGKASLDEIIALRFTADARFDEGIDDDQIVLINGDRMTGFVLSLGKNTVEFQPVVNGNDLPVTDLPLDRLAGIRLGNPMKPQDNAHHRVLLRSGMRLSAESLNADIGMGIVTVSSPLPGMDKAELVFAVNTVERIDIASSHGRLVPLADLPYRIVSGGEVFGRPWLPRTKGQSIHLHAPIVMEWDLPRGATRLAATAHLDVPRNGGATGGFPEWADFTMTFEAGGNQAEGTFNMSNRTAQINLVITGDVLSLTLDDAANGPVMDRLRLDNAVLLMKDE